MYNFDSVTSQAKQVVESSNSTGGYKYSLLYPNTGTVNVRLLFNPSSGLITRLIHRHTIGDNKVPCMKTWGEECPICKLINEIEGATGLSLGSLKSKSRGISLVQFINATYPVGTQKSPINPGDVILMMYPWSVYKALNEYIAQIASTPTGMIEAFTKLEAYAVGITKTADNKYQVVPNPYMKYRSPGVNTDEEFCKFIESIESLSDQILPVAPTEEVVNSINLAVETLTNQYLNVSPTVVPGSYSNAEPTTFNMASPNIPTNTPPTIEDLQELPFDMHAPVNTTMPTPACFGKHVGSPACMMCPAELSCKSASSSM